MTRPPFAPPYDKPFQPPPDVWTATIGGNNVECHIVKSSVNIRMGKNEPFPVGQADTGTATFEIIGDPTALRDTTFDWNDAGGAAGLWTDSGMAVQSRTPTAMVWVQPNIAAPANIVGKRFQPHAWIDLTQFAGQDVAITMAINGGPVGGFGLVGFAPGNLTWDYRQLYSVTSGKPGQPGTVGVVPWTNDAWHTAADQTGCTYTARFTVPANGWLRWGIEMRVLSAATQPAPINITQTWNSALLTVQTAVADVFDAGEQIVVKRNGATVWTGWVADEERSWSPSAGSVSTVNGGGPRRAFTNAVYAPEPASYTASYDGASFVQLPNAIDGHELVDYANAVDLMLRNHDDPKMVVDVRAADGFPGDQGGPGLLPIRKMLFAKGGPLPKPLEILDGAANTVLGFVWETRAGILTAHGPKWYAGKADPALYDARRVTIACTHIDTPVTLRRDAGIRFTRWVNRRGWNIVGHNPSSSLTTGADIAETTFEDRPAIAKYGPLDFNPSPVLNTGGSAPNSFFWAMVQRVARGADIEQVDQWKISRDRVDEATWQRLLTIELGDPVRIPGLPTGLFRDGTTQFDGFCFGWSMRGTDTVTLTLIDARVFKA